MVAVYNRDNSRKIPYDVTLSVDFQDASEAADETMARVESTLIKIENDILTKIDWLKQENPDLSDAEAEALLARNISINDSHKVKIQPMSDSDEETDEEDAEEQIDGVMNDDNQAQ